MQNGILALLQPYSVSARCGIAHRRTSRFLRRLLEQGYASLKLHVPRGAGLIRYVKTQYGAKLSLGAGTVCQPAQAEAAAKAGAEFW